MAGRDWFGKPLAWLGESNRWKHLLGGLALGVVSDGWWCACLVGAATGGAMEMKDWQHGGKPDGVDAGLTLAGALAGHLVAALLYRFVVSLVL